MLEREIKDFYVWTPELVDKIDKVIDGEIHDVGRRRKEDDEYFIEKDYGYFEIIMKKLGSSFDEMVKLLWLDFGDIIDKRTNEFLETKSKEERYDWYNRFLEDEKLKELYEWYIPDDVLALALLHHLLDYCEKIILNLPIEDLPNQKEDEMAKMMAKIAKENFYKYYLSKPKIGKEIENTILEISDWLLEVLEEKSIQIFRLLRQEIQHKGLDVGLGPEKLSYFLYEYWYKKGYYGILNVNYSLIPIGRASAKIWSKLRKEEKVTIGFYKNRPIYSYERPTEEIEASNLKEIFEKLTTSLKKMETT